MQYTSAILGVGVVCNIIEKEKTSNHYLDSTILHDMLGVYWIVMQQCFKLVNVLICLGLIMNVQIWSI